jgi:hypothetical protein
LTRVAPWVAVGVLAVAILSMHTVAVSARLPRAATFDEAEHLHAAWLMSQNERLYRDFSEAHSPFLPMLLESVQPSAPSREFPRLDVARFLTRGRLVMAFLGTLGTLAAALFAWRISGSRVAPLVVVAAVLGSEATFLQGIAEVRNDPPTLFLFWTGALLVTLRSATAAGAARVGLGLGCIGVAAVWNPKWPFESLVLGGFVVHWLFGQRSAKLAAWTAGVAAVVLAASLVVLSRVTTLGDYVFFTHTYNLAFVSWFDTSDAVGKWFAGKPGFFHCALPFHGFVAAIAWVVVAAAFALPRVRGTLHDRPGFLLGILLVPAAFAEMLLLYPWPRLWPQYYLMWSFVVAIAYGSAQAALSRLFSSYLPERARWAASACVSGGAAAIAAGAYFAAFRELSAKPEPTTYFRDVSWVQRNLREGDTVWMQPSDAHPIGANDASYYWFAFGDLVPFSLAFARAHPEDDHLPKLRMEDLPPCRAADGSDRSLRFVSLEAGALAEPCMKRLSDAGRLRTTPIAGVLAVEP